MRRCFGPVASAVMNGRLISVSSELRQLDLGFLGAFLQALKSHAIFAEIDAVFFFEFFDDPVDDALVDVVAAEVGVASGGFYFDYAFAHFEIGNVKRATAQVVDGDLLVFFLVETVRQCRRGRLIDDADDFQARRFRRLAWWPGVARH